MSMCGSFLMHLTVVSFYASGFQAIRHYVMGLSGMSMHVRE